MGYDLHITRKKEWSASDGPDILLEDWTKYASADVELHPDPDDSEHGFVFRRGDFEWPLWWDPILHEINTKNPSKPMIVKMVQISKLLNARVLGDDGEEYGSNGEPV